MKKISPERLLEICAATPKQVADAAQFLGQKLSYNSEQITAGIEKGFLQTRAIKVAGVERYLLVFHVNDQRILFINAAVEITRGQSNAAECVTAMKQLAAENKCVGIEAMTFREGVLKELLAQGFETIGVSVAMKL